MSEFKIGRSNSSTGNLEPAALALDRVLIVRDSILQWKLEGKVFYAQQGDAATKLDFAETAYDEDQPQFALRVPQGIICIPLVLNNEWDTVAGTGNYIVWSTTTNDIGAGTSTALTPVNYRRDNLAAPACKANSLYTGDATAATGLIEIKRWYKPYAEAAVTDGYGNDCRFTINDPEMPILVGPATIQLHAFGATKLQGFGEYMWVELDARELAL